MTRSSVCPAASFASRQSGALGATMGLLFLGAAAALARRPITILQDLQGPKVRLGTFVGGQAVLVTGAARGITLTLDAVALVGIVGSWRRRCDAGGVETLAPPRGEPVPGWPQFRRN